MTRFLYIIISLLLCLTPCDAQKKSTATKKKATATATTKKSASKKSRTSGRKQAKETTPTNSSIRGLRNEQARIKQTIRKQEQALRANKAQVKQKLQDLERISTDMNRHQKSIDSINTDIHRLNGDINMLSAQLDELNSQLADRKASYVKSLRYMAQSQHTIQSQLMFIFSASNFRQMFRRMRFVRQYAAYQRTQGVALKEKQKQVNDKRSQLHNVRGEKSVMLTKGHREQNALAAQKDEQQKLVSSLQNQQKTIQAVIEDQKKKDAALNAQIDRLVAEEIERARQRAIAEAKRKAELAAEAKRKAELAAKRKAEAEARRRENERRLAEAKAREEKAKAEAAAKAREAAEKERSAAAKAERERAEQRAREAEAERLAVERKARADEERSRKEIAEANRESHEAVTLSSVDRAASGSFEANKGRMPLPVAGGRIVSHFGQHGVEGLPGVVLDNKGINILGSRGAAARSIFNGEVSGVANVGGSWLVLVRHGAYISVYCNLASVSVSKGQKISTGQALGTVGRDNILQFQLRKERAKLNPEQWIR